MTRDEFQKLMKTEFETLVAISNTKGHDYAGEEDALLNFKDGAERLGLAPEQIWWVYADKHWDAITTFVKEGAVQSEAIEGRIHDLLLYGFLLLGLIKDKEEGQ